MKLAFLYEMPFPQNIFADDGLQAALDHLRVDSNWDIELVNLTVGDEIPKGKDFYLAWGAAWTPVTKLLAEMDIPKKKKGLAWAGGATWQYEQGPLDKFGVVFVEAEKDLEYGKNFRYAFGVNTKTFKPAVDKLDVQKKIFDAIMTGAVSAWKRPDLFAIATSELNTLWIGERALSDTDVQTLLAARRYGFATIGLVSPPVVNDLMNASYCTLITTRQEGGSGRTMLESLAANIPVIVMANQDYLVYYATYFSHVPGVYVITDSVEIIQDTIKMIKEKPENFYSTRDVVLKEFSEVVYADRLKAGIVETLNK